MFPAKGARRARECRRGEGLLYVGVLWPRTRLNLLPTPRAQSNATQFLLNDQG